MSSTASIATCLLRERTFTGTSGRTSRPAGAIAAETSVEVIVAVTLEAPSTMHWQRVSEIFEALSSGVNSLWTASQTWMLFVPRRKYSWAAQRSIPAAEGNGCVKKSSRFSRSENASEIFGKKTTHAGKCSRRNIDYLGLALLRRINEPADAEYFPS
jgi:hypothetical protein